MRFDEPTAIAGPITANLFVASSAPDTELFVQLIDRAPDGTLLYLNRGMLRASHRQIDRSQSQLTADGRIYRPWRPHTERALVTPGEVVDYLIDVFPVGHVFLPGHELVVKVHAPPLDDNDYAYVQKTLPGVNTLHFGGEHAVAADAAADPDERGPGLPRRRRVRAPTRRCAAYRDRYRRPHGRSHARAPRRPRGRLRRQRSAGPDRLRHLRARARSR